MLVFSKKKEKDTSIDFKEFNLKIEKKIFRKKFLLIDNQERIAHESTLFFFTPLSLSLGVFRKVIGNCQTNSFYRGKGLYGMMVKYICLYHCRIDPVLFVEDDNFPSIKGLEKIGFEVVDRFKIKRRYLKGLFYTIAKV